MYQTNLFILNKQVYFWHFKVIIYHLVICLHLLRREDRLHTCWGRPGVGLLTQNCNAIRHENCGTTLLCEAHPYHMSVCIDCCCFNVKFRVSLSINTFTLIFNDFEGLFPPFFFFFLAQELRHNPLFKLLTYLSTVSQVIHRQRRVQPQG